MDREYEILFRTPIRFRIIEKRTHVLEEFVRVSGLAPLKSVKCGPLSWCERKRCFVNVENQVKKRGGKIVTGWMFCEFEGRMIETEAHAVWSDYSGRLHDITPHEFQPARILFSPDEKVAKLRGYTAPHKLIYTTDEKIRAIEMFDWEVEKLIAERFQGFGEATRIEGSELDALAARVGLPLDVAYYLSQQRTQGSNDMAHKYMTQDASRLSILNSKLNGTENNLR